MRAALCLLILFTPISFANAESLRVDRFTPAPIPGMESVVSIAVDRVSGPDGDVFADALERHLAWLSDDGMMVFEVINPRSPTPPDAIVTGAADISVRRYDTDEKRKKCVERDANGKCVRKAEVVVECLNREVSLSANIRIVDEHRGQILYTRSMSPSDSEKRCDDDRSSFRAMDEVVRNLAREAASEIPVLAPRFDRPAVDILEERKGLPKDWITPFRDAIRLTKTDRSAACDLFEQIAVAVPGHSPTQYNLGLCYEAAGRADDAASRYDDLLGDRLAGRAAKKSLQRTEQNRIVRPQWEARQALMQQRRAAR